MNFNFIIPSWSYWAEPTRAQPLTQLYLATILENEGHKVDFTDFRDGPKEPKDADAYLYTVASPDFKEVSGIVKQLRTKSQAKHIAGGPHPSLFPDESLKVFDTVVRGKGEEAIKQIAFDLESGVAEGVYAYGTTADYPFPRRDFLPKDKIVTSLFKTADIPSTTVLFSHGCPHLCTFCANYDRSQVSSRGLESISSEIDYLKSEYGIKGLSLQDEICIPKNEAHANKFLGLMASKEVSWRGQSRAGVESSILELAAQSGCVELSFGLESVDQDVLNFAKKGMRVETVKNTLLTCKEYGIKTRLYLLNGLPREPENIVEKTKKFIDETNPDVVLLSTLQPYPGSDIHDNPGKYGIEWINQDYSIYNHLRCRFKDSNDNLNDVVPFRYAEGKGFSRERIVENLQNLQSYLIERGLNK